MKTDRKVKAATNSDTVKTIKKARGAAVKPRSKSNGKDPQATYEHAPIGIVESSLAGVHIHVNEEFCRILGYDKEELLGRGLKDFTYDDDYQIELNLHNQLIAGKIPFYRFEKRYVRKDGSILWVELTRSVVCDAKGKPLYTIGVILDISDRKQVESVLRDSVERLRIATSAARMFMWEWDLQKQTYKADDNSEKVLGFSGGLLPEDTADAAQRLLPPEDQQDLTARLTKAIEHHDDQFFMQLRMINPENGQTTWLELNARIVYNDKGNAVRLFGVSQNITERKRTEQALAEAARQQEALYQLADQLHRTNSLEGVFNAALDAILSALQCDRASILLYDNTEVMHFVAWRGLSEEYRQATDGHSPWTPDVKDPEPIFMNDVDTADLSDSLKAVIKAEGIASLAFIPLVSNGKLIGKFMVYFNAPHIFSEEEVDLSLTIAHQLAFGVERTRAEEALRRERELLTRLFETMPVMISIYDPATNLPRFNAQFEKLIGWKPEEVTFLSLLEACYPDPEYRQYVTQTIAAAEENEWIDVQMRTRDGRTLETTWSNIRFSNGMNVGIGIDVTERRQAEKRLILLSEISELVRTLEDPNELLYAVSRAVGEHLQVKRCLFNEIDTEHDLEIVHRDYCRGVESVAGIHKVSDYSSVTSAEMAAGKTVVNSDSKTDPRTAPDYERSYVQHGERAYVAVPMMRDHRWVASLWVSDDQPRQWAAEEVSLLEAVAERTWTVIEKLKIAEALLQSEERLRAMFTQAGVGVCLLDVDYTLRQVNPKFCQIVGYEESELLGRSSLELTYEADKAENIRVLEELLATDQETVRFEKRYVHKNVSLVWVRINLAKIFAPNGSVSQLVAVIEDITERKRAEEALRTSEDRLRLAVAAGNIGIWDIDLQRRDRIWTKEGKAIYGLREEEFLDYEQQLGLIHPDDRTRVHEMVTAFRDEGTLKQLNIEHRIVRPDGSLRWVDVRGEAIYDGESAPVRLIGTIVDITERKRTEEALRASEALYRTIARSIPSGGVYVVDKDLRYLVAEGIVTETFGLSREMLEGHTVHEIFKGKAGKRLEEHLRRAMAGEITSSETTRNGRVYWSQYAPLLDSIGQVIVVTQDITERKQAEDALRQSEERFTEFMQHLPGPAWIKDAEGRYVYANAAAEKAFRISQDKLYGKTDQEIFPADVAEQFRKNDEQALSSEKGLQVIETLEHEDGVLHHSLVSKFAVPGRAGNPTLIGGTAFDITERLQAEEALRESEERFRAIIKQATAGIVRKDPQGRFIYVNQAFCNMLGYTETDLLGKTVWDFMHADDVAENKASFHRLMKEGVPFKLERRFVRSDGALIWVDASVSPIMDSTGRPQSAVAVEVDITGRRQAEESLQQLNLELESRVERRTIELQAANQALQESHERLRILSQRLVEVQEDERRALARELHDRVGQTLAALNINLIIINGQLSEDIKQQVGSRMKDSMQLTAEAIALIRNVMTDLRPAVLDDYGLEAALESYIDVFKNRYNLKVLFDHPDHPIPRLGPSIEMTFLRIGQEALMNVARHAKASEVTVSLQQQTDAVSLAVQDNGTGIESWQNANRPGSHGLTIMHERAEAFGGNLKVKSVPGQGTTIQVTIPIPDPTPAQKKEGS